MRTSSLLPSRLAELARPRYTFPILILLGFMGALFWGYSLGPYCSAERERANDTAKEAEQQQHATQNYPAETAQWASIRQLLVKARVNPVDSKPKAGNAQEDQGYWKKFFCEAKFADISTGFFTWCLVIVGIFQAYYLWNTVIATNRGAEALPKIERAYIYARKFSLVFGTTIETIEKGKLIPAKKTLTLRTTFKNDGKTPGQIVAAKCDVRVVKTYDEAADPRYPYIAGRIISPSEETKFHDREIDILVADLSRAESREDGAMLVLFGTVDYLDVLGEIRYGTFLRRWDFKDGIVRITPFGKGNSWG